MGKFFRFDLSYNLKRKCVINEESINKILTDTRKIYLLPRKLYGNDLHPGMHKFEFDEDDNQYYVYIENSVGIIRINDSNSIVLERGDINKSIAGYSKDNDADILDDRIIISKTVNSNFDMIHICGSTSLYNDNNHNSINGLKSIYLRSESLDGNESMNKNIDLRITLHNINDKYIDTMAIINSKGHVIKNTGSTNIINPYNIYKTTNSTRKYSVFFVSNELVKYSKDADLICDKLSSYSYKDLINKANDIEGISISNDMIYRGRGFFIKIESSKAYTVEEFGRYLNSIGGLNVVYPLEKPIYPVESLIDSNIATYSGGTIVYNPYNATVSLFYKSMS